MEPYKVLIADDEMISRGYMELFIRTSNRYEIAAALPYADDVFAWCEENPLPDLVVMDVLMAAGTDGLTAAGELKKRYPRIKIIVTTSMADADWTDRAKESGIESFWFKTYPDLSLLEVMDRTMAGESAENPSEAHDGRLVQPGNRGKDGAESEHRQGVCGHFDGKDEHPFPHGIGGAGVPAGNRGQRYGSEERIEPGKQRNPARKRAHERKNAPEGRKRSFHSSGKHFEGGFSMKKILRGRKLLTLLLAAVTIVVLTVCAHAAMIEEPEAPQTPEEFWDAVRDLELSLWDDPRAESESMNEPTGYESLLPQIEELVRSYANYEVGSLHYKDGILVWRSDGITCGYSPEYRNRMRQYELEQTDDPFEPKGINRSLLRNLGTGADIQATGFNNGSTPDGVVNVCTFVPYDGTEKNNFMGHEDLGKAIASYTGGTSTYYGGTNADIDTLAKALEECAVVVIGSHGTGSGAIGVTTNTGLTTDDYTDDHTIFFGIYYKSGSTEEDYRLWSIDGTVIANHMTKDAPNNLLISSSCEFMKNDAMCAPLRDKGVAVVYGYSESVISASADQFEHALIDALSRGMTVADAIVDMRETVGCAWDTYYRHLSYEEVQQSGVAFPIVVSAEDEYPGEGNVNFVQTVGSTWKLPLKADLAGKYVIGLNESVSLVLAETGDPVTAASVASGSLPAGMTLSASGNQVLLTGTPTAAGKSSFTLSFSTASEGNRNREEEILVADYDYANAHTSSQTESWTARDVSMWTITPLTSNTGDQHEIKCALGTSEQIDTVQIRESSLDDSLRIVLEGGEVFTAQTAIPARDKIGRAKTVPADQYKAEYTLIGEEMRKQIEEASLGGEDA